VVKLKWEQKSKNGGFFRKNSIFFDPYIGIQVLSRKMTDFRH